MQVIHCIEGLLSYNAAYLTEAVTEFTKGRNVKIIKHPWNRKLVLLNDFVPEENSILCGHSYGGHTALTIYNKTSTARHLFLLDPRKPLSVFPEFETQKPCHNFYQTGFVKGYFVGGAHNRHLLKTAHTNVPKALFFKQALLNIL